MSHIPRLVRACYACVLFLALSLPAAAQQTYTISGTVSDSSGVLVNTTVTLREPGGATKKVTTDSDGRYRFDGLRAGAYEIAANHEGFAVATRTLTLSNNSREADFTLELGGFVSQVEVHDVAERSTAGGIDVPNRVIPSYVVSVSAKTLQEQGINDLASALENVSGVMTQVQYGVYEWYTIGGITQQSGNDFLYVDGMTLTGNRSTTQLNNVEEVQVLKGPNSILYGGSGAGQGGMVNLIRKKPSAVKSHDVQYRFGSFGLQEFTGATTGAFFGSNKWLYRVDGSYSTKDGWRQNAQDRLNVSPSITYLISQNMRVTANETFIADDYRLDAGLRRELTTREGVPFDQKMNPKGDFQKTRDWQNQIIYNWNINQRLKFTNSFFTRRNRDQYLDAESMGYNATTDLVTRAYLYYQHNRRPIQEQADLQGNFTFWGMEHHPMFRYEYSWQHNYTNRTGPTPGSNSAANLPLPSVPVKDFIAGTWVDTAPEYTNFPVTRRDFTTMSYSSVVMQDQFFATPWLAFNITVRQGTYDRYSRNDNYDNGTFVSRGTETKLTNRNKANYRQGFAFVPQASWPAVFRGFLPYFSHNTSFNPVNSIPADGSVLKPVENESYEIGNKWFGLNNRLQILVAARRNRDLNRVVVISPGVFEQVGQTTTKNVDFDMSGEVGRGFSVLANWSYSLSLIDKLRTDGVAQANGGLQFVHSPKQISGLGISKYVKLNAATALNLNVKYRHVGNYFLNGANTLVMPKADTADASVTLRRKQVDVAVNMYNITNKRQYFVSQINSGSLLYPGKPFNAALTLRYRFD